MPAAIVSTSRKRPAKVRPKPARRLARRRGPSFAEGMRPFIGMIKHAPPGLSMREGFGD